VLKFQFAIEAIIIFVKSIKKGIEWYVHFIGKSIIWIVIYLPGEILMNNNVLIVVGLVSASKREDDLEFVLGDLFFLQSWQKRICLVFMFVVWKTFWLVENSNKYDVKSDVKWLSSYSVTSFELLQLISNLSAAIIQRTVCYIVQTLQKSENRSSVLLTVIKDPLFVKGMFSLSI